MIKNKKKLIAEEIQIDEAPLETKIFVDKGIAIAERIHARLNELKWTQKEFADRLGKTEEEISRNLGGLHNFTLKTISKYEAVLGINLIETAHDESSLSSPSHNDIVQEMEKSASLIDFHKWVLKNRVELITEKTLNEPEEKFGLWRWARTPIIKKDAGGNFGAIPQGYDYYTDRQILDLYELDQPKLKQIGEGSALEICGSCGHLSIDEIKPPALACCPESNWLPVRDFVEQWHGEIVSLKKKFIREGSERVAELEKEVADLNSDLDNTVKAKWAMEKEIERLKGLVQKQFTANNNYMRTKNRLVAWEKFKTENNL